MSTRKEVPVGFSLKRALAGHTAPVSQIGWSADGERFASASRDGTVCVWETDSGELLERIIGFSGDATSLAWSPDSRILALGSVDRTIRLWDTKAGPNEKRSILKLRHELEPGEVTALAWNLDRRTLASGHNSGVVRIWDTEEENREFRLLRAIGINGGVTALAWSPDGKALAVGSTIGSVALLSIKGRLYSRSGSRRWGGLVTSLAWSPIGALLASASVDHTIRIFNAEANSEPRTLEGHTGSVLSATFSADGRVLASKSLDGTVRLWSCDTWEQLAVLPEPALDPFRAGIAFHPTKYLLATLGDQAQSVRIWDVDVEFLLAARPAVPTVQYCNAKIVLVGDTGVGKSGLALVLTGQPFQATDSTHGRRIWSFNSYEVKVDEGRTETREALLWDLAGQPGYRIVHQLHLNEVAVALVVFDSRSETDPFAGVRHWDRALRQARRVEEFGTAPLQKFLVAARTDRGGVSVTPKRIQALVRELGFDGFHETSAKELRGIPELGTAIRKAIDWEAMPKVSSNDLFQNIKGFLLREKESGRLLSTREDLYLAFVASEEDGAGKEGTGTGAAPASGRGSRAQFDTCIGRLEWAGLIRRLSFGNLVLLQPELLDTYASAMVNAAKSEPEGLGSIVEEDARIGRFYIPQTERLPNKDQERLILVATVEDLLRYEIALREPADDAPLLVFPSQFTRENPDLPDPEGRSVIFRFEGPITSVYTTLAVRLSHSGIFKRKEMWKNAATYTAMVGGTCGLFLREVDEGRADLTLFFDERASEDTRFQFEEYVRAHLERRALPESIQRRRIFECENEECKTPVTDQQATKRRRLGFDWIQCNVCGERVSLKDRQERGAERAARIFEMDRSADARRDFEASMVSAAAETGTPDFKSWAGGPKTTLAVVFTDIVKSTELCNEVGDERMNEIRGAHFRRARTLLVEFGGYEIKTIGDAFMVAFHTAVQALNFALGLSIKTGHDLVKIRAGIHIGPVRILEEDAFGTVVNFTARVVGSAEGAEIWLSEEAKKHVDHEKAMAHEHLHWVPHPGCKLKGFPNTYTLWSVL